MLLSVIAICVGASLGAISRWLLGLSLSHSLQAFPLGTLAANLIGGYLVGVALGVFGSWPQIDPEWRLFVITGFLGGLTTFSAFSAEVSTLLMHGRLLPAGAAIAAHVGGSLLLTLLGLGSVGLLRRWLMS